MTTHATFLTQHKIHDLAASLAECDGPWLRTEQGAYRLRNVHPARLRLPEPAEAVEFSEACLRSVRR